MIPELRKKTEDDEPYTRPPEIQAALEELYAITLEEVVQRADIPSEDDPGFVPTECLLHFVRHSLKTEPSPLHKALFAVLISRIEQLVPDRYRPFGGRKYAAVSGYASELRDWVMNTFLQMLQDDRDEYRERLDFFEIRFNKAMCSLRLDGERAVIRRLQREKPMQYQDDSSSISDEMEIRLASIKENPGPEENLYRFELLRAIGTLPPDERRVIYLRYGQDLPIESKNPNTRSIASVLGCSVKTVSNRLNRAFAKLRVALGEEGGE